jgi:hypothetical protein
MGKSLLFDAAAHLLTLDCSDWSWIDPYVPVEQGQIGLLAQAAITEYLSARYPWQKDDRNQLLQRQSEFVITTEMLETLRKSDDDLELPASPKKAQKTPSLVLSKLRSIR